MPTVYVTAPPDVADDLARTLVEERLAACVNRVDCRSVYRWDGAVHDDDEEILLAKTTDEGYAALKSRVVELHPYDVPCIERFDETDVLPAFGAWREDAVGVGADGERAVGDEGTAGDEGPVDDGQTISDDKTVGDDET